MTTVITKFIIKTLCDHQGCLDFRRLEEKISLSFTVAEPVLRRVLFDDNKIAIQTGTQRVSGGQILSPDSLVVAKTSLRICQKRECGHCDELHLCRYYVCGDCSFGQKCKNPHNLATPHNAELLKRHGVDDLTEKQVFQLLMQNDPYLLPEICPHFNKGNGLHGSCKFNTACTKLHVCQHYMQGDCKFGQSCKRTHDINTKGKIFHGVSQENIRNLLEIYRNKLIILGQYATAAVDVVPEVSVPTPQPYQQVSHNKPGSPTGSACLPKPTRDTDKNEICLFFISKHCLFQEKCMNVHWHLPYKWQVSDGVTWKDLPKMEDIERTFCDPGHSMYCMSSVLDAVDFVTMKYRGSPVRRLSTASSVCKPPQVILTTQWLWYWQDESGRWLEYGQDGDTPGSVTSETLENLYLADKEAEIPFGAGKHQYILSFKGKAGTQEMFQRNLKFKTERGVRRRPRFVSSLDVKARRGSATSHSSSTSTAENVPPYWDKSALPELGYKLVPLSESAVNYTMIKKLFKRTMPHRKISSIQRIQNPSLWKLFQWQKEQMKKRNGGKDVNQQYLFHGTDEGLIPAICEQNFDWRMCGSHGTAYGKGSYFARDASYSDRYATALIRQNKIMFVALVLVGEYCKGRSQYVRPPAKDQSTHLFDSCVDNVSNPSIYVIFEKQQIYPEYIIHYM